MAYFNSANKDKKFRSEEKKAPLFFEHPCSKDSKIQQKEVQIKVKKRSAQIQTIFAVEVEV